MMHLRRLPKSKVFTALLLSSALAATSWADVGGKSAAGVRFHGGDEIILQGFHWNSVRTNEYNWYNVLKSNAQTIKNDGFTAVWMPPPWRDESSWNPAWNVTFGGEGYFWTDFNKNSRYGSDAQLRSAASTLSNNGIKVVYDIVPNHNNRGLTGDGFDYPNGQGYYRTDCMGCDDGDPFMAGDADLNTGHPEIFARFRNELNNLRTNYSASGFRFDFVRGFAPERINAWMAQSMENGYCVGELWKGPKEYPSWDWRYHASWQEILKDFTDRSKCSVFDFALKERMQNSSDIRSWQYGLNANPSTQWREVAVTFVDNHDTGYSPGELGGQHHWPLADWKRKRAYAYILTTPGTPTVFWSHMYDWGLRDYIRNLISIRKAADIRAWSSVSFHNQFTGLNGVTQGVNKKVVFAIDSNLNNPNQLTSGSFTLVVNEGGVRIWRQN